MRSGCPHNLSDHARRRRVREDTRSPWLRWERHSVDKQLLLWFFTNQCFTGEWQWERHCWRKSLPKGTWGKSLWSDETKTWDFWPSDKMSQHGGCHIMLLGWFLSAEPRRLVKVGGKILENSCFHLQQIVREHLCFSKPMTQSIQLSLQRNGLRMTRWIFWCGPVKAQASIS